MDVNEVAGSLEIYLGIDVIVNSAGTPSPVQWLGYDQKMGTYQGALREKDRILNEFERKLARCAAQPGEIESYDWGGIRAIINTMVTAFHEGDAEENLMYESRE